MEEMKKYLVSVICGFLFSGPVSAEMPAERRTEFEKGVAISLRANTLLADAVMRAMEQCSTTRLVAPLPFYDYSKRQERTLDGFVSIDGWSGGCVDGKRDGDGVLSWHTKEGNEMTRTRTAEGRFVKGQRIGMWCITKYEFAINGNPYPQEAPLAGLGCSFLDGHSESGPLYIKQPDGRWQEYVHGVPGASFLASGELEAKSAKLLADAAAGKTDLKAHVVIQSHDLDDLVRGSKIRMAPSEVPIPLKDKRVAIVLSSQTVSELERFKRERQSLIDASVGLRGEAAAERDKFIQASNPDRLLANILKVVKRHTKDAQPADDLAGMREGGFDYALVVDWKSTTRFDQLGKYSKNDWPTKPSRTVSCIASDALRGFLISRELIVVKQLPNHYPFCEHDFSSAAGDQAYMWILAKYYASKWGNGPDDLGPVASQLSLILK